MVAAAIVGGAVIGGGATLASGIIGSNAAESAANTQAQAAQNAQQLQAQEFNQTQANLAPYVSAGVSAQNALSPLIGTNQGGNPLTAPLTAPFQPTMSQLAQTPGYQFTLNQGLMATQNSFAAQGLGTSGAALQGGVNYAEGLASNTYQNQFNNYLAENAQTYNMLQGQVNTGENAAAQVGSQGIASTANQANALTSGAAATAAGTVGSANAITNAISNISGGVNNTGLLLALNNQGLFGNSASNTGNVLTGNGL